MATHSRVYRMSVYRAMPTQPSMQACLEPIAPLAIPFLHGHLPGLIFNTPSQLLRKAGMVCSMAALPVVNVILPLCRRPHVQPVTMEMILKAVKATTTINVKKALQILQGLFDSIFSLVSPARIRVVPTSPSGLRRDKEYRARGLRSECLRLWLAGTGHCNRGLGQAGC